MVKRGIVLDHVISRDEVKVGKVRIDLIVNLRPLTYVKEVRSFLGLTLNDAQLNYIMIEKEFSVVIIGFKKIQSCLIRSHVVIYTDHCALYLLLSFCKKDGNPRLMWWIMILQEFDCEIRDKKGYKNIVVDHLSKIICDRDFKCYIFECFPCEQLFLV